MLTNAAIKDLKSRIAHYEVVYETISESEQFIEKGQATSVSFIKVHE
jgi:hypothetical protein